MGRIAGSKRVLGMRKRSAEIYAELARETGRETGFVQNGGITIATTQERLHVIRRWYARAHHARCMPSASCM
jgi:glycine/D-amino acid oxidase-like deaminating enzyme